MGQQLLPMAYVQQKMQKPDHFTWDQFLSILNREFKIQQDLKIKNMAGNIRQRRAWDKANAILAEQNAKKERDRLQKIADEKKKQEDEERECKHKEEERQKKERERKEAERKQHEQEEREHEEQEALAQQQAEEMAKQLIPSFLETENGENVLEDLNLSALSSGKGNSIDLDSLVTLQDLDSLVTLQEKTVDINQRNFDIANTLGKNLK